MSAGMDSEPSGKETRESLPSTLSLSSNRNTEERPHHKLALLAFWPWTSGFYHFQRINGCFSATLSIVFCYGSQLRHRAVCDDPHQGHSLYGIQRGWNTKLMLRIRKADTSLDLNDDIWNLVLLSGNHPGWLQRSRIWNLHFLLICGQEWAS